MEQLHAMSACSTQPPPSGTSGHLTLPRYCWLAAPLGPLAPRCLGVLLPLQQRLHRGRRWVEDDLGASVLLSRQVLVLAGLGVTVLDEPGVDLQAGGGGRLAASGGGSERQNRLAAMQGASATAQAPFMIQSRAFKRDCCHSMSCLHSGAVWRAEPAQAWPGSCMTACQPAP